VTYFRRYGLLSILGIVADDDDGNLASRSTPAQSQPAQVQTTPGIVTPSNTVDALPAAPTDGLGGGVVL
jgi:hypothetical protein